MTSSSPVLVGSEASHASSALTEFVRTTLQLPWPSPASGTEQADPLDFRWLTSVTKTPPVALTFQAWAREGRARGAGSPPLTNSTLLRTAVRPTGVTAAGR